MSRASSRPEMTSIGKPSACARLAQELRARSSPRAARWCRPRAPPARGKPRRRSAKRASASSARACVARSMRLSAVSPAPRRTVSRSASSGIDLVVDDAADLQVEAVGAEVDRGEGVVLHGGIARELSRISAGAGTDPRRRAHISGRHRIRHNARQTPGIKPRRRDAEKPPPPSTSSTASSACSSSTGACSRRPRTTRCRCSSGCASSASSPPTWTSSSRSASRGLKEQIKLGLPEPGARRRARRARCSRR